MITSLYLFKRLLSSKDLYLHTNSFPIAHIAMRDFIKYVCTWGGGYHMQNGSLDISVTFKQGRKIISFQSNLPASVAPAGMCHGCTVCHKDYTTIINKLLVGAATTYMVTSGDVAIGTAFVNLLMRRRVLLKS